jgi:Fe-S-cluster containining protein
MQQFAQAGNGAPRQVAASFVAPNNEAAAQPVETLDEFEQLRNDVADGLMYSHSRENANTSKVLEVASFSYALIELLNERGLITLEELDERKRKVGQRLADKFAEKGMGVALTDDEKDKYAYEETVQIDCDNRIALCRGACCRLRFALTVQDLEEGAIKWELGRPYMIRHDADGYCHHLDGETKHCGAYQQRPIVCRSYDCRKDKRIWADFENRVVSPDLEKLFPAGAPEEAQLYQLTRNGTSSVNGKPRKTFSTGDSLDDAGFQRALIMDSDQQQAP